MKKAIGVLILLFIISNCEKKYEERGIEPSYYKAMAILHPKNDSEVTGTIYFEKAEQGVRVMAEINGLTGSMHGFHIHQFGDCSANDGTSAGGHFNPRENEHSSPDAKNRHMGDMGNITANDDGVASLDYIDSTIILEEIIGRGIIVHGGEDDLESQPSGAAGPRISCGVIGIRQ